MTVVEVRIDVIGQHGCFLFGQCNACGPVVYRSCDSELVGGPDGSGTLSSPVDIVVFPPVR
jgi:hypothetical protein